MTAPKYSLGVMVREVKKPTFEDTLERIHDMGFESVQFNLNVLGLPTVPASLPAGKAGEIGASFWAYGLNLAAISGTFNSLIQMKTCGSGDYRDPNLCRLPKIWVPR